MATIGIFSESKTDPIILPLKTLQCLPVVIKINIKFIFMTIKAHVVWPLPAALTPTVLLCSPHPGFFLLSTICWLPLTPNQSLCKWCLLCQKHFFSLSDLSQFQSYTCLCNYYLRSVSLTVLELCMPALLTTGSPGL